MKYLASRRIAVVLIITLVLLAVIGMTVPQDNPGESTYKTWQTRHVQLSSLVEALQFNRVFSSWWLKAVFLMFFINMTACTYLQFKRLLKSKPGGLAGQKYQEINPVRVDTVVDEVCSFLAARRYRFYREKDEAGCEIIIGKKYAIFKWSTFVFHVGLLVIILGIIAGFLMKTDGIIPIMEGQSLTEDKENYVSLEKAVLAGSHSGLPIMIKKVTVEADNRSGKVEYVKSLVQFGDDQLEVDDAKPVSSQGFTVYQNKFGYTLILNYIKRDGTSAAIVFPLMLDAEKHFYANEIEIPDTTYVLLAFLYPDAVKTKSTQTPYISKGEALINPIVYFEAIDNAKKKISTAYLQKGKSLVFDGIKLRVDDIGYWSALRLVRDPGIYAIYLGFAVSMAALLTIYLFIPRQVYVRLPENGIVEIGGWTSHYRNLFKDELDTLAAELTHGGIKQ